MGNVHENNKRRKALVIFADFSLFLGKYFPYINHKLMK